MYPVLLSLGPLHFYSFGTLLILGIVLSWFLLRYLVFFYRLEISKFYYALPWVAVGSLLAARLGMMFTYTERFRSGLGAVIFPMHWWAEWAIWAGIGGAIIGFVIYLLKHNEPVFLWLDVLSLTLQPLVFFVALGLFLSPVGLTAEALGKPTILPWGVMVDAVDLPFANVPVHPLLLYIVFVALLAFCSLWMMRGWARAYIGRLFVLTVAWYSVLWFLLSSVRWYTPHLFIGLDVLLLNAFLYAFIAGASFIYIVRKHTITQKMKAEKNHSAHHVLKQGS